MYAIIIPFGNFWLHYGFPEEFTPVFYCFYLMLCTTIIWTQFQCDMMESGQLDTQQPKMYVQGWTYQHPPAMVGRQQPEILSLRMTSFVTAHESKTDESCYSYSGTRWLDPGSLFLRNKLYWIHEGPSKLPNQTGCVIAFHPRFIQQNLSPSCRSEINSLGTSQAGRHFFPKKVKQIPVQGRLKTISGQCPKQLRSSPVYVTSLSQLANQQVYTFDKFTYI